MKIYRYGTVESTQKIARQLLKNGVTRGSIIVADSQIEGRGRLNRTWLSPPGGLYCSIIIEGDHFLSVRAAVAVAATLHKMGIDATIKWPNDIMVQGRKIAGILIEISGKDAILGVGINRESIPLETGTSLFKEGIQISRNHLLTCLYDTLKETLKSPKKAVRDTYKKFSVTLGKHVTIQLNEEELTGVALDIDMDGGLLIESKNGKVKKILTGDCIHSY
jgi:BirA family biotin operon repressor/biotin-[acetyl-CoA-carboxylase] ligase